MAKNEKEMIVYVTNYYDKKIEDNKIIMVLFGQLIKLKENYYLQKEKL